MQNIDFLGGGDKNRSLTFPCICMSFLFIFKKNVLFWLQAFVFTAIRQEIKDIEEGRYDSKMNPLKVSIEQI